MKIIIIYLVAAVAMSIFHQVAKAEEARPSLIHVYQTTMKNGKAETRSVNAGLVNMDDMMLEAGSGSIHPS